MDITVHDHNRRCPTDQMKGRDDDGAESGRGLHIVQMLSDGVRYQDITDDGTFARKLPEAGGRASDPRPYPWVLLAAALAADRRRRRSGQEAAGSVHPIRPTASGVRSRRAPATQTAAFACL